MIKISYKSVLLLAFCFLCTGLFMFQDKHAKHDENVKAEVQKKYAIYALPLPSKMQFVGESVPMKDPEIREQFDRELLVNTYWQSQTLLFHKRAARYFPVIEPILKKNGVPNDFKYLALIESGLTNIVSPAGATGFWQIMSATGKQYGLEINKEVDERYHLEKATQTACDYLKEAYGELGSWTLAAASYNMGISGIKKQMERQQADNYYGLTLNSETARYIFRIMAVKEIMENPLEYGFHFRTQDLYAPIPTYTVEVDTAVSNFSAFAAELGINYRILKFHNPWLRYDYLPNRTGKKYQIAIPKNGHYELVETAIDPEPIEKEQVPKISD
jgi:membrane-bound lytic murein transglycosylase D